MRRTPELEQEQRGFGQVLDHFREWKIDQPQKDLGEDLVVQIYEGGSSTGLTFYLQLKTCATFATYTTKRNRAALSYPFEVKDLLHWECFATPVLILIWDVSKSRGHWTSVEKAIAELNARNPMWREKQSVVVRIPLKNKTDRRGRAAIRQHVANQLLPLISRGKAFTMTPTFRFPRTTAGTRMHERFRRAMDEGDSVTIPGKYISSIKVADWWRRAFGDVRLESLSWSSTPGKDPILIQLEATSATRTALVAFELRRVKGGLKKTVLSNDHTRSPHHLAVVIEGYSTPVTVKVSYTISFPTPSVRDSLSACRFLVAASQGGSVGLVLADGKRIGPCADARITGWSLEDLLTWEGLLQKLNFIETKTSKFGRFTLPARLSAEEIGEIDQLYELCTRGEFSARAAVSFHLNERPPNIDPSVDAPLRMDVSNYEFEVLGVKVQVGSARIVWDDRDAVVEALRNAQRSAAKNPKVAIRSSLIRVQCPDWMPSRPDGDRLSKVGPPGARGPDPITPARLAKRVRRHSRGRDA